VERIGTIETACRYPVKSMAGEEMDEAFVGFAGMMGDRAYAFVPTAPTTKGFPWHTGREQETMVLYRPRYRDGKRSRLPVDVAASFAMKPGMNTEFPDSAAFAVEVTTPDGQTLPVDAPELAAELGRQGGTPVKLRFSERGLYDCRPMSIIGNASVRALGEAAGKPMDRRRFRANVYADWEGGQPYREDELVGRVVQIGDRLRITVLERDPRCKMITLDPDTAEMDPRVLRHVAQARGGKVGVYAAVLVEGIVRKGDPILLV